MCREVQLTSDEMLDLEDTCNHIDSHDSPSRTGGVR